MEIIIVWNGVCLQPDMPALSSHGGAMIDRKQLESARQKVLPTPSRTSPSFQPLSARYLISAKANRHDADDRPLPHFFYASGDLDAG